jgi:two-component system sensor histidine kinase/response regulator
MSRKINAAKILIVDDTPKNIQVLGSILRERGFEINVATNGREAVETAEKIIPDIILLDIMMPVMDGYEACKILKASESTSSIPIIFLTAKTEAQDILQGFELGAADYVTKPFNSGELLARVNTHLEIALNRKKISEQNLDRKILIQVIGHDLTNPLSGIKGIVEVYEYVNDIAEVKELLPFLKSGVESALNIVELIRTLEMIDSGDREWSLAHLRVLDSIQQSYDSLKDKYQDKEIIFNFDIKEDDCVIAEKTSLIQSVFVNLLDNAFKFTNKNGEVNIKGEPGKDDTYVLKIRDNGMGMDKAILNNLFSLETKSTRPGTMGELGIGFGLLVVKRFMDIYEGVIKIDSEISDESSWTEVTLTFKIGSINLLQDI